jgi:hypothetical protein
MNKWKKKLAYRMDQRGGNLVELAIRTAGRRTTRPIMLREPIDIFIFILMYGVTCGVPFVCTPVDHLIAPVSRGDG